MTKALLTSVVAALAGTGLTPPSTVPHPAVAPKAIAAAALVEAPEAETAAPADDQVSRAADGLFYTTAIINGARIRFLVDTGANVVLLTADAARRAGIRTGRASATMATAGGASPLRMAVVDRMHVGGREIRSVQAGVVGRGLPISLLGQSALAKMKGIYIEGDTLHLM